MNRSTVITVALVLLFAAGVVAGFYFNNALQVQNENMLVEISILNGKLDAIEEKQRAINDDMVVLSKRVKKLEDDEDDD